MTNLLNPITLDEYHDAEHTIYGARCSLCLGSFQIVGTRRTGKWQLKCRECGELAYQHTIIYKEVAEKIEAQRSQVDYEDFDQTVKQSLKELGF